jgi:hypothetical protein
VQQTNGKNPRMDYRDPDTTLNSLIGMFRLNNVPTRPILLNLVFWPRNAGKRTIPSHMMMDGVTIF